MNREQMIKLCATEIKKTQHDSDCAILAGITRMYGCTCGLFPRKQPKEKRYGTEQVQVATYTKSV